MEWANMKNVGKQILKKVKTLSKTRFYERYKTIYRALCFNRIENRISKSRTRKNQVISMITNEDSFSLSLSLCNLFAFWHRFDFQQCNIGRRIREFKACDGITVCATNWLWFCHVDLRHPKSDSIHIA